MNHVVLESDDLVVTSSKVIDDQLGVITKHDYKAGELLFIVDGAVKRNPTRYSFSIGIEKHIDPHEKNFGHYMNHSCDPNAFVRVVDKNPEASHIEVLTRKNIKTGEELTLDFASFENEVTINGIVCKCGTDLCRGKIHGFKDLPQHVVEKYKKEGIIPAHLLKIK